MPRKRSGSHVGHVNQHAVTKVRDGSLCHVEGCRKPVNRRVPAGPVCDKHYYDARMRGEVPGAKRCSVEGCERFITGRNLCATHYARARRQNTGLTKKPRKRHPMDWVRKIAKRGSGSVNKDGYRSVSDGGRRVFEHRLAAERVLGRALLATETVHHRNGVRLENTVGPCLLARECKCDGERHNLELWTKSQPPGQRVADKIQWAKEILALYEAERVDEPR